MISEMHKVTSDFLQLLISGGETIDVEFKGQEHAALSDHQLIGAFVCMANRLSSKSGWLLIGVEDDGRITGTRPRHNNITDINKLSALIASRTRPSISPNISVCQIDNKDIIAIEIDPQEQIISTSDGVFTRRIIGGDGKPSCIPMDSFSIQSLQADRSRIDPSACIVSHAHWDDLDPLEFERVRRCIRERRGRSDESLLDLPDLELAKALGVIKEDCEQCKLTLAALLLFGKEDALRTFVPTHEVAFQVLQGLEVEVNDFFRWPLFRTIEEIESRIRARNREKELMMGLLRIGIPDYPERALREAFANAMIHRDYSILGAIHFQWYENRIEISNPGGFPEGVRLENLLVTAPKPRNPLLADAFKRAGIVERTGRGIDTIFFEQLRNGRPAPSYARSNSSTVIVVLYGGEANLDFVKLIVNESQQNRALSLDALLILNELWQEGSLTTTNAARLIQKPETEARFTLNQLVESGLIEERGENKGRAWHLSAFVYRSLGKKAAYIRQHRFEPLQHEQMVLQYVEKNGYIARSDAAELCKINASQAYRLLSRLQKQGKLRREGDRGRAVTYKQS